MVSAIHICNCLKKRNEGSKVRFKKRFQGEVQEKVPRFARFARFQVFQGFFILIFAGRYFLGRVPRTTKQTKPPNLPDPSCTPDIFD